MKFESLSNFWIIVRDHNSQGHHALDTYLNVKQQPDVLLQARRGKILKQIRQSRHALMGFLDRAEGAQVFPIRVDDISIYSKAAFQCGILVDVSHQIRYFSVSRSVPTLRDMWCTVHTCEITTTPSRDKCISVSMAWQPAPTAAVKALIVFSGYFFL